MSHGFPGEKIFRNLITSSQKIKGFQLLSSEALSEIASSSKLGRNSRWAGLLTQAESL